MKKLHVGGAPVRIFAAGNTIADTEYDNIPHKKVITTPGIIVKSRGYIGFEYWDRPFTHKNEMWSYTANDKFNPKFIYYYLTSHRDHFQRIAKANSVKLPQLSVKDTDNFNVPLPPLPVQNEIVRILDTFTNLTAELTAELTARKKQYEYYRDKLLTFADGVEYKPLSDLFNTRNGYTPSKSNALFWENGTIPWFRIEDIRANGGILTKARKSISKEAVKGKPFPANSIIISTSATVGEHALVTVESLANQQFTNLTLKANFQKSFIPKFLYYYCFKLDEYCISHTNKGNFLTVNMNKLNDFMFPLPPLKIQEYIVSILDRFDKLCNDLTQGLPAEIEARKKQYEYYRNALLTFKQRTTTK